MTTLEPADVLTRDVVHWGRLCSAIPTLPRSPGTTAPWRRGASCGSREVTGLMALADGDKIMGEGRRAGGDDAADGAVLPPPAHVHA